MWSRQAVQATGAGWTIPLPAPHITTSFAMKYMWDRWVVQDRSTLWSRRDASGGAGWSRRSTLSLTLCVREDKRERVGKYLDRLDRLDRMRATS